MANLLHDDPRPSAEPWSPPDPDRAGVPRIVGIVLVGAAGVAIGVVRYMAEARYQAGPERLLQAVAFGVLVASPALLASLSTRRRAILLAPAALLLTPLAFLSLAGVLLPLLIPGVLFWWALVTRWDGLPCGWWRGAASVVVVVALVVGGGVALFAHEDPRSYETATGGGSTGDVVTSAEALISLACVGSGLLGGWLLATPRRIRRT